MLKKWSFYRRCSERVYFTHSLHFSNSKNFQHIKFNETMLQRKKNRFKNTFEIEKYWKVTELRQSSWGYRDVLTDFWINSQHRQFYGLINTISSRKNFNIFSIPKVFWKIFSCSATLFSFNLTGWIFFEFEKWSAWVKYCKI